jgi:copper chaperone CopZ
LCGIGGCTSTFRNYFTWRKHIKRVHANVENVHGANNEEINIENGVFNNNDQSDEDDGQRTPEQIPENEIKKAGALYLLNLQEACRLPKTTINSVLSNTKTIIEDVVSNLQGQVEKCLQNNGIDFNAVEGLKNVLSVDNPAVNAFENLESDKKRVKYYKEYFGLKVYSI